MGKMEQENGCHHISCFSCQLWDTLPSGLQHQAGGQGGGYLIPASTGGHQAGVRGEGDMEVSWAGKGGGRAAGGGGEHVAGTQVVFIIASSQQDPGGRLGVPCNAW